MPDLQKTVEIVFGARDDVSRAVSGIGKSLDGLETAANTVAQPLADIAGVIEQVDAALAALVVGGLALAVRKSGEFGTAFSEISTLIHDTDENIARFRESILKYAAASGKSIGDINGAVYEAISTGVDYRHSLEVVGTAEKLAIAGKAGLRESLLLLVPVLNAYGKTTDQAGRYADIFFKTVELGQTTIPQLAQHLAQVTGIAANAGVPIETLTASIAALTAGGLPTSEAITGIKAAISNIIKPAKEASETASALGIQFDVAALKSRGFDGIMRDVQRATGGNVEQMAKLFGSVEGLNVVMTLANDKTGRYRDTLREMGTASGATDAAYAKMANNFDLANQRLANNFDLLMIGIGDRVRGSAAGISADLSSLFQAVTAAVDAGDFDPLFAELGNFGEKIRAFLRDLSESFPAAMKQVNFDGLLSALRDLGGSFAAIFDDFDPSDTDDVAAAIQGVVDTVESLIRISGGIVEALRPAIAALREWVRGVNESPETTRESFGRIIGTAQLVADSGIKIVGMFIAIGQHADTVTTVFTVAVESVSLLFHSAKTVGEAVLIILGDMAEQVYRLLDALSFGLTDVWGRRADAMSSATNALRAAADDDVESMEKSLASIGKAFGLVGEQAVSTGRQIDTAICHDRDARIKVVSDAEAQTRAAAAIETLAGPRDTMITPKSDAAAHDRARKTLDETAPNIKTVNIDPQLSQDGAEKIKAVAGVIEKSLEWKAKLDIADVEAGAKIISASFASINEAIKSSGDLLKGLWDSAIKNNNPNVWASDIARQIEDENRRRADAFELQRKLTDAQVAYMEGRTKALARGDALIRISGDGLEPELEAFMWRILDRIQVRAAKDQAEFLLGIMA